MKKFFILSLASLSLFYLTSCTGGAGVDTDPSLGTTGTDGGTGTTGTGTSATGSGTGTSATGATGTGTGVKTGIPMPPPDHVATLAEAIKAPHVFKPLCPAADVAYDSAQLASAALYHAIFDVKRPGHTIYIGAYDTKNKVIIRDKGSVNRNSPFVQKDYFTGKIEHGEINLVASSKLNDIKLFGHTPNPNDDMDDNDIFKATLGKHNVSRASCYFTFN